MTKIDQNSTDNEIDTNYKYQVGVSNKDGNSDKDDDASSSDVSSYADQLEI